MTLEGIVSKGLGIASGLHTDPKTGLTDTISKQKRYFEESNIPNITGVYNGTINLDISPKKFEITYPDYEVTCTWDEGVTETFWFVDVFIDFNNTTYKGYIYYPCPSEIKAHNDDIVELLAEEIPDLNYGDTLSIRVSSNRVSFE